MLGYSFEQGCCFLIRNIRFWDYMAKHPDSSCSSEEAEKYAEELRQELFSYVNNFSLSETSIKKLEERGLIRKQ